MNTLGPYRLSERLGEGGMGPIFLAEAADGSQVVLHTVHPELADDKQFRQRLAARIADPALRGPGLGTVVAADPYGDPAWVATAADGPPLSQVSRMSGSDWWLLGAAIAGALATLHSSGLVHGDVSPYNVLMSPSGPRLIGAAVPVGVGGRVLSGRGERPTEYLAPEQPTGQPVGPAADLFALGSVLCFAATGHGPFEAPTAPQVLHKIVNEPPDLTGLARPAAALVADCLSKAPSDRPDAATMQARCVERASAGDDVLGGDADAAHGAAAGAAHGAAAPTRRLILAAGVAALVAAGGAGAFVLTRPDTRPDKGHPKPRSPGQVLWTFDDAGPPESVGVVADVVCVGSMSHDIDAVDARNGRRRWTFRTSGRSGAQPSDGAVTIVAPDGLHRVDAATGAQHWAVPIDQPHEISLGSAPGLVVTAYSSAQSPSKTLHVLDSASGTERWAGSPSGGIGAMAAGSGLIAVVDSAGTTLHALNLATGKRLWEFHPAGNLGQVWIPDGRVYVGVDSTLHALHPADGRPLWSFDAQSRIGATLETGNGLTYVATEGPAVHALDPADGRLRWTAHLSGTPYALTAAGPSLLVGGEENVMRALDTATGSVRWSTQDIGRISAIAVRGATAYVASGSLYAIQL